jgi:hypothetical protein
MQAQTFEQAPFPGTKERNAPMTRRRLHPSAALRKRWLPIRRLGAALLAATCALALVHAAAATPRESLNNSCDVVTAHHSATATNSAFDWTDMDFAATNGSPAAIVLVTPSSNGGVYDAHPLGVW